jgi:hypothetical protein
MLDSKKIISDREINNKPNNSNKPLTNKSILNHSDIGSSTTKSLKNCPITMVT